MSKLGVKINCIAIIQEARCKLRIKNNFCQRFSQFLLTAGIIIFINSCNSQTPTQTVDSQTPSQTIAQSSKCGSPSSGIQDNPVAAKYGNNTFPLTNNIKWNCVYNIKDFPAASINDSFNAARDAAFANGGGVVYFPSGTYNFTDNIYLKNGVVIRGDSPAATDAKSTAYNPPTKLVFPQYIPSFTNSGTPNNTAFKKIFTTDPTKDSNIGVVNIDINRAAIEFTPPEDLDSNTNQNIVIFGVRSNNVAEPDPKIPSDFQNPWQRFSYRFAANIKITAFANVLISNNRLNDAVTDDFDQPNYILKNPQNTLITYPSTEGGKATFSYTDHYGIILNRSNSQKLPNDRNIYPRFFRKGLVIQDNWVYHTMRVAIQATGDGLIVKNNQIKDKVDKQAWIDPTGTKQPRNSVTLENRAIDWSGWNVTVEGNNYEVYRHKIMNNPYYSVDGEGILIQECCGGTSVNGAIIRNNTGNTYIGIYKVPEVKNVQIVNNQILNDIEPGDAPSIYVSADTNNNKNRMDNVQIQQNTISGSILAKASNGGSGNAIANNTSKKLGKINYSCGITLQGNVGFAESECEK